MVSKSLREWLRVLEQDGVLKHVGREVNLEHELAAVGKKACGTYAVWFDIHLYPQRYVYLIRLHPHFCHFERSYYHE